MGTSDPGQLLTLMAQWKISDRIDRLANEPLDGAALDEKE